MKLIDTAYASEVAAEALESHATAPAEEGVLASLGINPSLFAFQLINFLLVASVIWFIILKPLTKKMTERQKMIDESLDNAKKIQEKMILSEREYQERIDQAKVEANKIIEQAGVDAAAQAEQLAEKSKRDIELLIAQAKRNIQIEKDEMVVALKKETAGFVALAVEKFLGEKMTSAQDKKMIEEILASSLYAEKK